MEGGTNEPNNGNLRGLLDRIKSYGIALGTLQCVPFSHYVLYIMFFKMTSKTIVIRLRASRLAITKASHGARERAAALNKFAKIDNFESKIVRAFLDRMVHFISSISLKFQVSICCTLAAVASTTWIRSKVSQSS